MTLILCHMTLICDISGWLQNLAAVTPDEYHMTPDESHMTPDECHMTPDEYEMTQISVI